MTDIQHSRTTLSPSRARNSPAARTRREDVNSNAHVEIVPDSEEDRQAGQLNESDTDQLESEAKPLEVIVISSDDEAEAPRLHGPDSHDDPFAMSTPGPSTTVRKKSIAASNSLSLSQVKATPKRMFRPARRIVESSDSEDGPCSKGEAVELTDSDSEETALRAKPAVSPSKPRSVKGKRQTKAPVFPSPKIPLYDDDDEDEVYQPIRRDEAILVLNEPKSHRKTIPLQQSLSRNLEPVSPSSSPKKKFSGKNSAASVSVSFDIQFTPSVSVGIASPSKKQPRLGKKAAAAARLEELKAYAQTFFDELNVSVFDSGIPATTQLTWNNRMTTTAGKASYHRSREGVSTSTIELAIKILDNEDRIRRTLSHEMCHLACWIISGMIAENHGSLFKSWAAKVHSIRPDIVVSTTHDYEIKHPYQWKCQQCSLIYGRFSNSINPDKVGCATCSGGRLVPLFTVKSRKTPQTPKASRMAASKPRDSPSSIHRPGVQPSSEDEVHVTCIHDNDSEPDAAEVDADSDIEILTTKLSSTTINGL